jgi:hypothetical protein
MIRRKYALTRQSAYMLIVIFVSALAASMSAVLYAGHVDRESNKKWCNLVVRLDDTYRTQIPTSQLGRDIANEFKQLRQDFDCNN